MGATGAVEDRKVARQEGVPFPFGRYFEQDPELGSLQPIT